MDFLGQKNLFGKCRNQNSFLDKIPCDFRPKNCWMDRFGSIFGQNPILELKTPTNSYWAHQILNLLGLMMFKQRKEKCENLAFSLSNIHHFPFLQNFFMWYVNARENGNFNFLNVIVKRIKGPNAFGTEVKPEKGTQINNWRIQKYIHMYLACLIMRAKWGHKQYDDIFGRKGQTQWKTISNQSIHP